MQLPDNSTASQVNNCITVQKLHQFNRYIAIQLSRSSSISQFHNSTFHNSREWGAKKRRCEERKGCQEKGASRERGVKRKGQERWISREKGTNFLLNVVLHESFVVCNFALAVFFPNSSGSSNCCVSVRSCSWVLQSCCCYAHVDCFAEVAFEAFLRAAAVVVCSPVVAKHGRIAASSWVLTVSVCACYCVLQPCSCLAQSSYCVNAAPWWAFLTLSAS